MNNAIKSLDNFWRSIRSPLLAIAGGLLIGGLIMLLAGYNALEGYSALLDGAFGGKNSANLLATLVRTAPIVGLAIAASVAFKAGFFNIGLEGQMVLGAIASTLVGIYSPFPTLITAILVVLTAILVAGGYALISAWLDVRFSIPIFISSLLLNYPARFFSTYLVNHPFRDVTTGMVETNRIPEALQIPKLIPNTQFHIGVLFVPILVIAMAFIFRYTKIGYQIRLCGYNKNFLEYGGVNIKRLEYRVVFVSGAIAGMIGLLEVFGLRYRYIPGMLTSPLYAWTAVTTAILANSDPIGVLLAGFMLAAIQNGGFGMERMSDIPREISRVIQSIIIMIVSAVSVFKISSNVSRKED